MINAELIQHMGSDLVVVNAARCSFSKHKEVFDSSDEKLIKYLATHNHFTPFTHCMITLRETVPLFIARQRFKHVVGFSYNEVSRRYVDDTPEFHIPDVWRSRPEGSVKQGSGPPIEPEDSTHLTELYRNTLSACTWMYDHLLAQGIAPEQARMVLPQSMLTSYYVTGSLSAFARAYKLRADGHAQQEIQLLARQWDEIIRPLFPTSWAALAD